MAIAKKVLKGAKTVGKALTKPNTIADGGGLSSLLVPRKLTGPGAALVLGGTAAFNIGNEGIKSHNAAKMGKVSYGDGMTRMTNSFTSGAVPAMKNASNGNYAVFSNMAQDVVSSPGIVGSLDTYGATPELVSALYNMGGR